MQAEPIVEYKRKSDIPGIKVITHEKQKLEGKCGQFIDGR